MKEAMAYALRLLARRAYAEAELRAKLLARFPEEAQGVVERLKALGYLDDRALAQALVASRRKYGPHKLKALLRARGVREEVIQEALAGAPGVEEAKALLLRHPKGDKARAVRFLLGRGFPLEVALEAYRLAQEEEKG